MCKSAILIDNKFEIRPFYLKILLLYCTSKFMQFQGVYLYIPSNLKTRHLYTLVALDQAYLANKACIIDNSNYIICQI